MYTKRNKIWHRDTFPIPDIIESNESGILLGIRIIQKKWRIEYINTGFSKSCRLLAQRCDREDGTQDTHVQSRTVDALLIYNLN